VWFGMANVTSTLSSALERLSQKVSTRNLHYSGRRSRSMPGTRRLHRALIIRIPARLATLQMRPLSSHFTTPSTKARFHTTVHPTACMSTARTLQGFTGPRQQMKSVHSFFVKSKVSILRYWRIHCVNSTSFSEPLFPICLSNNQ